MDDRWITPHFYCTRDKKESQPAKSPVGYYTASVCLIALHNQLNNSDIQVAHFKKMSILVPVVPGRTIFFYSPCCELPVSHCSHRQDAVMSRQITVDCHL